MQPDQHFGTLLKHVFHLWHQVINERLRPRGMSHSQWRVLLELSRSTTPMTQSAIAAELGVESPTLVRLLDRLEDKGWVAREPCPTDRRARLVRLTPYAQRLARELEEVVAEVRCELLQDLRPAEVAGCIEALSKIEVRAREALRELRGPTDGEVGDAKASDPGPKPRRSPATRSRRGSASRNLPGRSVRP